MRFTKHIDKTGKCSKTGRYGYSCFYFENDYLKRESVDRYWQPHTTYLKPAKDDGFLCSIYTSGKEKFMVESPYPPTDEKFMRVCNSY